MKKRQSMVDLALMLKRYIDQSVIMNSDISIPAVKVFCTPGVTEPLAGRDEAAHAISLDIHGHIYLPCH